MLDLKVVRHNVTLSPRSCPGVGELTHGGVTVRGRHAM
jgi:hypothetical protein